MWSINPQAGPIANIYVDYMPQTILQNAFFGNLSWDFGSGLKASVGARWYHYSYSQSNTEWGDFTPYGFDNLLSWTPRRWPETRRRSTPTRRAAPAEPIRAST